jgi:DNA-binding response OmpR family regulator
VSTDSAVGARAHVLLIVEDEPSLLRAFSLAFERLGYDVLTASDVPSALAQWRTRGNDVSLIVSDVQMPGPQIEVLITEVKRRVPAPLVLLMSGDLRGTEQRIADLMSSVDGFVPKPLRIQVLRAEVERLLAALPTR